MNKNRPFQILLGIFILLSYISLRFIRVRLPKEIPFNLSFYGMVILIFICSILFYSLFTSYFKNKNENTNNVMEFMFTPLKELDNFIKKYISPEKNIALFLQTPMRINLIMKLFGLFPKILISIVLLIETFYFHYLSFLYKIILLGIFVIIEKYIFFSLTKYKENLINDIENKICIYMEYIYVNEILEKFPEIKSQYYDEEEEDYVIDEIMIVPIKEFIAYQEFKFNESGNVAKYQVMTTGKGFEEYKKLNNIPLNHDYEHYSNFCNELRDELKDIIAFKIIESRYNQINNSKIHKYGKFFILIITLLCWVYILLVSLPNLYLDTFFNSLLETSFKQNPFQ